MCKSHLKLEIELVPKTSWFTNLRSLMKERQWDYVRKACYEKAGYRCEICNGRGPKHPVECHEIWDYDENKGVQTLLRTIALCPSCHRVKHIGLHLQRGVNHFHDAVIHFMTVNNIDCPDVAERHIQEAFALQARRSKRSWTLDVSWIVKTFPLYFKNGLGESRK